jgi:hypothetical protein
VSGGTFVAIPVVEMLDPLVFPLEHVVDEEGRPLREGVADATLRETASMDASALRLLTEHWDEIIAGLRSLRALYRPPAGGVRYVDLWRRGQLGAGLPAFLLYKRIDPVANGRLPAYVAAIFKIVVGLNSAICRTARRALFLDLQRAQAPIAPSELCGLVKRRAGGQLAVLITEAMATLIEDGAAPARPPGGPQIEAAFGGEGRRRFVQFAGASMNAVVLGGLYRMMTESLYAVMRREIAARIGEPHVRWFCEVDERSSIFADLEGPAVRALISRVIQHGLVASGAGGSELRNQACQLLSVYDDAVSAEAHEQVQGALRNEPLAAGAVPELLARYLLLEAAGARLSAQLRGRCLQALGIDDAFGASLTAAAFQPPNRKMRDLMGAVFGLHISSNTLFCAGTKVVELAAL